MTDNDRLLELAGYCRHDYYVAEVRPCGLGGKHHYHHRMGCRKCGPHPVSPFSEYAEPYQTIRYSPQRQELIEQYSWLPPVGDGHFLDLGEMVWLCETLWPECAVVLWRTDDDGLWNANVGAAANDEWEGAGDTPEAALRSAILAEEDVLDKVRGLAAAAGKERERQAFAVFSETFKPDVGDSPDLRSGARHIPILGAECSRCGYVFGYGDTWLMVEGEYVCKKCAEAK